MRAFTAVLLGAWLGASIFADIAVTQNFQAVDRFLAAPGNAGTSAELDAIGRERERVILRRNAGEENNWIFLNWERAELVMGAGLVLLFLLGESERRGALALSVILLAVVAAEHFFLTSRITDLGRIVDDLPSTDPRYKTFWTLHGVYSGMDILKIVAQIGLATLLMRQSKNVGVVDPRKTASEHMQAVKHG